MPRSAINKALVILAIAYTGSLVLFALNHSLVNTYVSMALGIGFLAASFVSVITGSK